MGPFSTKTKRALIVSAFAGSALIFSGYHALRADDTQAAKPDDPAIVETAVDNNGAEVTEHAECSMFGAGREKFAQEARNRYALSKLTDQVTSLLARSAPAESLTGGLPSTPGGSRTTVAPDSTSSNVIDKFVFAALRDANIAPADKTSDVTFLRRVSLDLTGRIPTPDAVQSFVNDPSPDKRAKLVDSLLAKPEWIDKWTVYFGDKFKNTTRKVSSGVTIYDDGRNAFYEWLKASLGANKPYDQMARELIAAKGANSYDPAQAPLNWLVGARVANGPIQDIWDAQTSTISETFLGVAHVNCLLCHNGRGHLDSLSLWASGVSRSQAWQLSSFMSHTNEVATKVDPMVNNGPQYWAIQDNVQYKTDYTLNTTTGNRPARQPVANVRNVAPVYIFTGETPKPGENYRDALARMVTADPQFARAAVNYIWKEFFGRGIVDPANQFDPARLDPNNPPPDPWTLQSPNLPLLNALAQDFAANGYDIKKLMKQITTSDTYQLSSAYNGTWNPQWENMFARKLVRRLWSEEVMDALAQSSGMLPTYTVNTYKFNFAMQSPEPLAVARGNNVLTAFIPGNRDDQERKSDGAVQQGLAMMNDALVMARTRASGTGATATLLAKALPGSDEQLVQTLYLNVLSRYPTQDERTTALAALKQGNRQQKAEDLLWSLYNKVDFLFNY